MKFKIRYKGGPGSGHRGHSGRPGKRGGSAPGTGGGAAGPPSELVAIYKKSGGVDEWGDPIPSPEGLQKSSELLQTIMDDKRSRNLAIALAADGDVSGLENYDAVKGKLVDSMFATDPEMEGVYSNTEIGKRMRSQFVDLYSDYEKAISIKGHWQEGTKMTPEREAWERTYYGKVVGGHEAGQAFAIRELNKLSD